MGEIMDLTFDWPESIAVTFLIIGFAFALFSGNATVLYTVCFLMGLLFGRMWYKFRKTQCIPLFLVVMGFFLGFILGGIWANLRAVALLLLAGMLLGYWLHKKKIIRSA